MIEGMPWPVALGVAGGGWTISAYFMWLVFTGRVATKREVDEKNAQITNLTKTVETLNGDLRLVLGETVPTANAVMNALHQAVGDEETRP